MKPKKKKSTTSRGRGATRRECFAAAYCLNAASELEKILPRIGDKKLARSIADVEIELRYIASILTQDSDSTGRASSPLAAAKNKKGTT